MNEDLERVRKQLDYLVERAQETDQRNPLWGLVQYLRIEGIKGIPGRARRCPIANYLRRETGLEVGVSTRAVAVDNCDGSFDIPPVVSEFINNFDRGAIMELDAGSAVVSLDYPTQNKLMELYLAGYR